jgi:hypothetical protein
LDPDIVGHYRLEVANDVFNGVGKFGLVTLPSGTRSAVCAMLLGRPAL